MRGAVVVGRAFPLLKIEQWAHGVFPALKIHYVGHCAG
jgi:hypothetical protein